MTAVSFVEPASVEEACALLAADPWGATVVAGGTAVVLMMRSGLLMPDSLVSTRRLPGLHGIETTPRGLLIGASTTLAEVAGSRHVRDLLPSLAEGCAVVGNPRVRNVATLGGNLAEADYASDPPAVLASLGAQVHVTGPEGSRTVAVLDLITGFYETSLTAGELITHVEVPVRAGPCETRYLKYRSRSSEDRACVGVASRVEVVDGRVRDIDVVVGAVASTPRRVPAALERAVGTPLAPSDIAEVADAYAGSIEAMADARGSAWYRQEMIRVFVRRSLEPTADHAAPEGRAADD